MGRIATRSVGTEGRRWWRTDTSVDRYNQGEFPVKGKALVSQVESGKNMTVLQYLCMVHTDTVSTKGPCFS